MEFCVSQQNWLIHIIFSQNFKAKSSVNHSSSLMEFTNLSFFLKSSHLILSKKFRIYFSRTLTVKSKIVYEIHNTMEPVCSLLRELVQHYLVPAENSRVCVVAVVISDFKTIAATNEHLLCSNIAIDFFLFYPTSRSP